MSITPGQVGLQPDGGGQLVDVVDLTNPLNEVVVREVASLGDPSTWAAIASILNSAPGGGEYALVVRPIPSGTQNVNIVGGGMTTAHTDFLYGQQAVSPAATVTLVTSTTAAIANLWGFEASGEGNGFFELQVSGATVMSGRINAAEPAISRVSSAPKSIPMGTVVTLQVTASGRGTCNYEGTMLLG